MHIREIAENEREFLFVALYEAAYVPDGVERPPRSIVYEPSVSKYAEQFGRHGDLAYVLLDGDKLVGAIWSRLFSAEDPGYGFVDEETPEIGMSILEGYRGDGFGTQLIDRLIGQLQAEGYSQVSLSVDHRNPALRLYRRVGFEVVRQVGAGYTMLKRL